MEVKHNLKNFVSVKKIFFLFIFLKLILFFHSFYRSGKLKVPEAMDIVKSAKFKELSPDDPDWFYVRCAAILRHTYHRYPIGVGSVTKIFGGRKRNGVHPSHFCRSSNGVARKALQALEAVRLIEKHPDGGRKLTSQGQRDLDRIANQIVAKQNAAAKAVIGETLVIS